MAYRSHMTNRDLEEAQRLANRLDRLMNLALTNQDNRANYRAGRDVLVDTPPKKLYNDNLRLSPKEVDMAIHTYYRAKTDENLKRALEEAGIAPDFNDGETNAFTKMRYNAHVSESIVKEQTRNTLESTNAGSAYYQIQQYKRLIGTDAFRKSHSKQKFQKDYRKLAMGGTVDRQTGRTRLSSKGLEQTLNNNFYANDQSNEKSRRSQGAAFSTKGSYKDLDRDFNQRKRAVDDYLKGFGFDPSSLTERDINKMLKDGFVKQKDGTTFKLNEDLKNVLQAKKDNLKLEQTQKNANGSTAKNVAGAWLQKAMEGTDAGEGMRESKAMAKMIITSGKLVAFAGTQGVGGALKAKNNLKALSAKLLAKSGKITSGEADAIRASMKNKNDNISRLTNKINHPKLKEKAQAKTRLMEGKAKTFTKDKISKTDAGKKMFEKLAIARAKKIAIFERLNKSRAFKAARATIMAPVNFIGKIGDIMSIVKKWLIKMLVFLILGNVFLLIPLCSVVTITNSITDLFCSDEEDKEQKKMEECALLLSTMRTHVTDYLYDLEDTYNDLRDMANALLPIDEQDLEDYHAEITMWLGSPGDSPEDVRNANPLRTNTCTLKNGQTLTYSSSQLFKALICLGQKGLSKEKALLFIAQRENDERAITDLGQQLISKRRSVESALYDILDEIMRKSTVQVLGHTINVTVNDSGLADVLRLVYGEWLPYVKDINGNIVYEEDGVTPKEDLKSFQGMVAQYELSDEEWIDLGFKFSSDDVLMFASGLAGCGSGCSLTGEPMIPSFHLTQETQARILSDAGVYPGTQKYDILKAALDNLGYGNYSQAYRFSDGYFDCSSYVYRMFKAGGMDLGANTAASECQVNQQYMLQGTEISTVDQLVPGDLLFYADASESNGRYLGITHVGIYVGNGYMVDAGSAGTQYRPVWNYSDANRYLTVVRMPFSPTSVINQTPTPTPTPTT